MDVGERWREFIYTISSMPEDTGAYMIVICDITRVIMFA